MLRNVFTVSLVLIPGALAGCGSGADSVSRGGGQKKPSEADATPDVPMLVTKTGGGDAATDSDGAACARDHVTATPLPGYLLFIMDHSQSMSQDMKWPSCTAALETFFSSRTTKDLRASLTWLPYVASAKGSKFSCTTSDYETPAIPLTALPAASFGIAIAAEEPEYGTPTLPALEGTIQYAKTVQKAHPASKVLVVLATDGVPVGCTGNTVSALAAEAAVGLEAGVPTYVIGVGDKMANLDAIAAGGGTKEFQVSTSDPETTTTQFEAAVASIQDTLGCDYDIPSPGGGQTINFEEVNVETIGAGGKDTELTYSANCTNPDGWEYDHPSSPTKIVLCSKACATAEASQSVNIVFGCKTHGIIAQ
jgi:hypothetical protein